MSFLPPSTNSDYGGAGASAWFLTFAAVMTLVPGMIHSFLPDGGAGVIAGLDMGDRPGHLVWHAGGAKLRSIDELPAEYRRRAEKEYPALLSADPAKAAERVLPPKIG